MKTRKPYKSESGQAIVLIVLAIVGLFGFAALAIDGGMVFSDRRQAQNAADTAALAGALAKVNVQNVRAAALARAASNGYDNNGTSNIVEVHNPPDASWDTANLIPHHEEYIQVRIHSQVNTNFAQLVFGGPLKNSVEAIAHAKPGHVGPLDYGQAIVSLAPHGCKMFKYGGDSTTHITGSGVFVNSDDPDCALFQDNNKPGILDVPDGNVSIVGGANKTIGISPAGSVATGQQAMKLPYPPNPDLPKPTCSDAAQVSGSEMTPGNYSGSFPPGGVTKLNPGTYCVVGDLRINGGDTLEGEGVTISIDGNITFNGGAKVNLSAPHTGEYKDLLIYVDPHSYPSCVLSGNCTVNDVILDGNNETTFVGTIYAPASTVTITGNGNEDAANPEFNSQIIGNTIVLNGTSDTFVHYDPDVNVDQQIPPTVDSTQ